MLIQNKLVVLASVAALVGWVFSLEGPMRAAYASAIGI